MGSAKVGLPTNKTILITIINYLTQVAHVTTIYVVHAKFQIKFSVTESFGSDVQRLTNH